MPSAELFRWRFKSPEKSISPADLLPGVRCLTRQEKLQLIQLLAVELEKDDGEDERLQNAIHAEARQNAIGRMDDER